MTSDYEAQKIREMVNKHERDRAFGWGLRESTVWIKRISFISNTKQVPLLPPRKTCRSFNGSLRPGFYSIFDIYFE